MIDFGADTFEGFKNCATHWNLSFDEALKLIGEAITESFADTVPNRDFTDLHTILDPDRYEIGIFAIKEVVNKVDDEDHEISFAEASKLIPDIGVGEVIILEITPQDTSKIFEGFQSKIETKLKTMNPSAQIQMALGNQKTASSLAEAIQSVVKIKELSIGISNGTAVLTGIAKKDSDRTKAGQIAQDYGNVREVFNQIAIG